MKIRTGFVSNSSSSSFIVAFSALPKSVKELQAMLFNDEKVYPNPYIFSQNDPYGWAVEEVAATVWADLQKNSVISRDEAIEIGLSGYTDGAEQPQYPSYHSNSSSEERMKEYDEYHEQCNRANKKVVVSFLSTIPDGYVLVHFEYSDNDGQYFTALEHGPLFLKLKSLRISHH